MTVCLCVCGLCVNFYCFGMKALGTLKKGLCVGRCRLSPLKEAKRCWKTGSDVGAPHEKATEDR